MGVSSCFPGNQGVTPCRKDGVSERWLTRGKLVYLVHTTDACDSNKPASCLFMGISIKWLHMCARGHTVGVHCGADGDASHPEGGSGSVATSISEISLNFILKRRPVGV